MSQLLIRNYLNDLTRIKKISGSLTEGVISEAFKDLLKAWAKQDGLVFISQYEFVSPQKNRIRPDGTILHDLRVPFGYWEAKDTSDDLDEEIRKKFAKGYPQDNIIFENSDAAVLWQDRREVMRCSMTETKELGRLVSLFFKWERPEIAEFRKAVGQFRTDLPAVLTALRGKIDDAYSANADFQDAAGKFLAQAKQTINPSVVEADVREMLIQHILTEEIFTHVFNEGDFHRENNVAKALYELEAKFFTGGVKRTTLKALEPYYAAIRKNAAQITTHLEKQTFLKVIYENFYKVYNPKAADRLGVVYTPNEIVRFMIDAADWLTRSHFDRALIDRDVEVLDPATGTGTFICEMLEHFRGEPKKLAFKYANELHANEVAILPYYVANLNIEATYFGITQQYVGYPNLCFVDTLDNTAGLGIRAGHQHDLFGALSAENVERIKRQNGRKISVVIGNPPYNANQQSESDDNKNRAYKHIDAEIKRSYVAKSAAQKTKVYDMYARFYRWASDRLHDDGVLAFVTNRSFIESRTFDGFRKCIAEEFNYIYVVDLGGDVRANPGLSGTKHNVFGIQTGVAIAFLVKKHKQKGCSIRYARRPEFETAEDKLAYLATNPASGIAFDIVSPDKRSNWLHITDNDWDSLVPIADKKTKAAKSERQKRAIFSDFSMGFITARDEWLVGTDREAIEPRVKHLISEFNANVRENGNLKAAGKPSVMREGIKWSRSVKAALAAGTERRFDPQGFRQVLYRPYVERTAYFGSGLVEMPNKMPAFFPTGEENVAIFFNDPGARTPFSPLASTLAGEFHLAASSDGFQAMPRYRFTPEGRVDNVTDWGLRQFQARYEGDKPSKTKVGSRKAITKTDVFRYVYAALHDPVYREVYSRNLQRELPRVPLHEDFWKWSAFGERLLELHLTYKAADPWPLQIQTSSAKVPGLNGVRAKPILRADAAKGEIVLDAETRLTEVPPQAWTYRLGSRSAIEWVLDQFKEKKAKDATVRERFDSYEFGKRKDEVIELLKRVTRVSVDTAAILAELAKSSSIKANSES